MTLNEISITYNQAFATDNPDQWPGVAESYKCLDFFKKHIFTPDVMAWFRNQKLDVALDREKSGQIYNIKLKAAISKDHPLYDESFVSYRRWRSFTLFSIHNKKILRYGKPEFLHCNCKVEYDGSKTVIEAIGNYYQIALVQSVVDEYQRIKFLDDMLHKISKEEAKKLISSFSHFRSGYGMIGLATYDAVCEDNLWNDATRQRMIDKLNHYEGGEHA